MKKITAPNETYVVYTRSECTVTDSATGLQLISAVAGAPNYFTAIGHSVELSDETAICATVQYKDVQGILPIGEGYHRYQQGTPPGGRFMLAAGTVWDFGKLTADTDFSGLELQPSPHVQTVELWFYCAAGVTLSWPADWCWIGGEPDKGILFWARNCVVVRREPSGQIIANLAYQYYL